MSGTIVLPVFAGQGTSKISQRHAADQAVRDANSPAGAFLLSSCLDVFLADLSALSPDELDQSGICPSDFDRSLRLLIPDPKYAKNHIISATILFLAQTLRYQSYTHSTSRSFLDLLESNTDHAVGVLGLSSGIFPACVVAASHNPLSYITTTVQVFRLVFWIALRVMQFTRKLIKEKPVDPSLPWSVACLGLTKDAIEMQIARFEQKHSRVPSLRVTAVFDERNVTVSGRPDLLVRFSTFVSRHCIVHPTTVDVLYHSALHLPDTRDRVMEDIRKRDIHFPDFSDLRCPLRSTLSGDIVGPSPNYPLLVELVVDMVLVHPVNWTLVARKVASVIPVGVTLLAVNFGPGSSTLRALERVVPECDLHCVDATLDPHTDPIPVPSKQEPIAVIGMAARTPGAANTDQLWDILKRGISTISKIPDDRFHPGLPLMVDSGNFINDIADFDHKFFKVSPREAKSMDPQQRVLLHTAHEALESAGYVPDATPCFQRATFGCYIGAATQDYAENLADNIDIHYSTGTLKAFLSGRISYAMQFGGPSVVVDTACSSSIVAIHQACRALMVKDCDAALAGGVNIMTSPNMFVGLERAHFLSPSGQCKSFDASADGYSRGEGCCLFVLKRLSDAIVENDNILGIIRGVEVNQSGLASSITHPHGPTQVDLLTKLLAHSGVCPTRVSVVEAHGTGTEAGDSCELVSIRSVLSRDRMQDNPLHITSIKANIGHLEAASGAVGLCKLLLMLRHNVIPAQISLKTLHPLIAPLDVDHTVIDVLSTPWDVRSTPRVAVLNNFGASGSNGALILEEYVKPNRLSSTSSFVLGVSAKSAQALGHLRSRYMQWLADPRHRDVPLCDVAYTATARRQLYPFRLSVIAQDRDQLMHTLETAPVSHVENQREQVIFVFAGQASQYLDMGASLYVTSPVFKGCIDRCQRFLLSLGYPGILPLVSSESCDYVLKAEEEFEAYQCAVVAVEFSLATLWKHWGVIPVGVIGQSLGEYVAMVVAEVLSIETALSIVAKRARLMSRECAIGATGMASVTLPSAQVQEILTKEVAFSNVTVACVNTESSSAVSGPVEEVRAFATHAIDAFRCKATVLPVQLGFHSSAMDPILEDLRDHVATLPIHPPKIAIASNVYGTVVPVGDGLTFQAGYFVRHCRQPVLFAQGLHELEQYLDPSKSGVWIDVGPHAICLPMVETSLSPNRERLCLPSMFKEAPAWDTLMGSLAQLYRTGIAVDWRRVFDERMSCSCVDLPSYPFETHSFWVPLGTRSVHAALEPAFQDQTPDHAMLSTWSQYPSRQNGNAAIFETPIKTLRKYMEGHKVGGYALCPASVYLEQALAGAVLTQRHLQLDFGRSMPILRAVSFSRPLVLQREMQLIVRIHVTIHEDGTGSFSITSRRETSHEEHVHVHGDIRFSSVRETTANLTRELPDAQSVVFQDGPPEVFDTHAAYEVVFPRVVEYAKDYHTIQSLTVSGGGSLGIAYITLSGSLGSQPVFLDTLLHVAGFMVNLRGNVSEAYICVGVGVLKVLQDLVGEKQRYTVYCTNDRLLSGSSHDFVTSDIVAVHQDDQHMVVAHLDGAQFRRVKLTSLYRGLAMAADRSETKTKSRMRTNSNAIMAPASPRSVIFARSPSNTRSTLLCRTSHAAVGAQDTTGGADGKDEFYASWGDPASPQTLASETGAVTLFEQSHRLGVDRGRVRQIMAGVLGIADEETISDDADLGALGLDSLGSIEAQQALRVALHIPIPHDIFVKCGTVSALCAFLGGMEEGWDGRTDYEDKDEDKDVPDENGLEVTFVSLQRGAGSELAPLYLVHDGSGLVGHYERLSPLQRDVWGIADPRFFRDQEWKSLEGMARAYALAIERHADGRSLVLGGWSFGGVVSYEMARILADRGVQVRGIVLIDSPPPSAPPLLSDAIIRCVLRDRERTVDEATMEVMMGQFRRNTALLSKYEPGTARVSFVFLRCTAGYNLDGTKGSEDVDVPEWFSDRDEVGLSKVVGPWEDLVGSGVPVWDLPGHHFEPFAQAHVKETSAQLDRACRYLETR